MWSTSKSDWLILSTKLRRYLTHTKFALYYKLNFKNVFFFQLKAKSNIKTYKKQKLIRIFVSQIMPKNLPPFSVENSLSQKILSPRKIYSLENPPPQKIPYIFH